MPEYEAVRGIVEAHHADTGEFTVRVQAAPLVEPEERALSCVLTDDSELYVNDKFSTIDAIEVGDAVELYGYRDPNPRVKRFVVTLANITHPEPDPPLPDLTPTTTAPASQPEEE